MGGRPGGVRHRACDCEAADQQLRACEISALAFCRLLERWARGDAKPPTAGQRQAALRRAADRVETALTGLEEPLRRYLLELEAEALEGRSWYGGPGAAELLDWAPVLTRAGVRSADGAGRAGVPRAGRARPRARGTDRDCRHRGDPGPGVTLGRPLRPTRQPAGPRARGFARALRSSKAESTASRGRVGACSVLGGSEARPIPLPRSSSTGPRSGIRDGRSLP